MTAASKLLIDTVFRKPETCPQLLAAGRCLTSDCDGLHFSADTGVEILIVVTRIPFLLKRHWHWLFEGYQWGRRTRRRFAITAGTKKAAGGPLLCKSELMLSMAVERDLGAM
jgi:hypothetical protein